MKHTLFGQSPARYGLASLAAMLLALASWALMVVLGFGMVYLAFLLVLVAIVAGVLGIGTGAYYKQWLGVVAGAVSLILAASAVWWVAWSLARF